MFRNKRTLFASVALIASCSLINFSVAADGNDWKIEISPRFTLNRQTGESLPPIPRTEVFQLAQANEEAVPPPITFEQPSEPVTESTGDLPVVTPNYTIAQTAVPNYNQIYKSIPFSRAEYLANPSYRHDATMSILLGQPYVSNGPKETVKRVEPAVKTSPWSKTTPWFHSGGYLYPYTNYSPLRFWP
ncbi:MAG: hypothetical protein R3C11_29065 [Planctomycetaceae bacterium]